MSEFVYLYRATPDAQRAAMGTPAQAQRSLERYLTWLKAGPGKSMILFGSGSIVARLSELGLIDEYQRVVNPILLGRGHGWAPGLASRVKLQLVESHAYGAGNVMLRYKRA